MLNVECMVEKKNFLIFQHAKEDFRANALIPNTFLI
jgi:hypothetical protein